MVGTGGERTRRGREAARGWWATTVGILAALAGFAVIIWVVATTSPGGLPLNTVTFTGIGLAGIGIATTAIGLDRGAPG